MRIACSDISLSLFYFSLVFEHSLETGLRCALYRYRYAGDIPTTTEATVLYHFAR